jgi:hypothetical protein
MQSNRFQPYSERVRPRLATPLDHYVSVVTLWVQSMWLVWVAVGACVVVLVVLIAISKARARAHARVPHYRRDTGPIPIMRLRQPTLRQPPRAGRT